MSNATITVTLGDHTETFTLEGDELSRTTQADGSVHAYLGNGSKWHITEQIEDILLRAAKASA